MTIKSWKIPDGRDYCLCTDCAGDAGMETAWKQVTEVINNGVKVEDIEKMSRKLTKKPDSYNYDHLLRVGLRAAERYCLGKMLTGETEDECNTSHRWDALKEAITPEFLKRFSLKEVQSRLYEYFVTMAVMNAKLKEDPRVWVHYGIGFARYPSDTTRSDLLKHAISIDNRYYSDAYKAEKAAERAKFEKEVSEVSMKKYKITEKDQERIDVLVAWLAKGKDKSYEQAEKIGTPDKALARYVLGLKAGHKFTSFYSKARDLGVTEAEIEAYSRATTGKKHSFNGLLPGTPEWKLQEENLKK